MDEHTVARPNEKNMVPLLKKNDAMVLLGDRR